ncbi:MAG: enhanced serine sensitivity protein SseB [Ethanoligenens sp.]
MGFVSKLFGKKKEPDHVQPDKGCIKENIQPKTIDVNKPVENPKLKELLRQFNQNKTNDIMNDLFKEIATNAHFLSVIMLSEEPKQNENVTATFQKDTIMQFPMLTTQDEQSYYPIFTDWIELGKWQAAKSPKTLILSFDDYASMVLKDENTHGIVINPFSDNMIIDRELIEHLKTRKDIIINGVSKQVVTKDTQVLLGEPKNYPNEMVNAISDYLKDQATVKRVWLRLMQKSDELSFLLVVDFSDDKEKIFRGIADAARPYMNGMYLDIVPYQDGFGKNAVENVKPFYQK